MLGDDPEVIALAAVADRDLAELADAACRVIARNGLAGTTLAHVAEESGWSIGSMRHYFPTADWLEPGRPAMIVIGDGDTLQLYACPVDPGHPHTARLQ